MSKKRRPRVALGLITRADGVRVEVKSPTVWKLLNEQQQKVEAQHQVLEALKHSLAKMEADRDHAEKWVGLLDGNWWVRLGVRLGFVRYHLVTATPAEPSAAALRGEIRKEITKAIVTGPAEVTANSPATA